MRCLVAGGVPKVWKRELQKLQNEVLRRPKAIPDASWRPEGPVGTLRRRVAVALLGCWAAGPALAESAAEAKSCRSLSSFTFSRSRVEVRRARVRSQNLGWREERAEKSEQRTQDWHTLLGGWRNPKV